MEYNASYAMAQKPELRRELDEWVEKRTERIEDAGATINQKDVHHVGAGAEVSIHFTVPRGALADD